MSLKSPPLARPARLQYFEQAIGKLRRFQNGAQQDQTLARIFMSRHLQQGMADPRVMSKVLGAIDQPEIQFVFQATKVRRQLCVITFRIIDQVAWMNLEELCQQRARGPGQVPPGATLDLRNVRLANVFLQLLLYGAYYFELGHRSLQASQVPLYQA